MNFRNVVGGSIVFLGVLSRIGESTGLPVPVSAALLGMSVGRNILNHIQTNVSQSPLEMWSGLKTDDDQLVKETFIAELKRGETRWYDAPPALRADKDVVLVAVAQNGNVLGYVSDDLKHDKEVVLEAVAQHGDALSDASDDLKNDKEVVLAAVAQHGFAIRFASETLKNDKEVVLAAVAQNGGALCYASKELRDDKKFILGIVVKDNFSLFHVSDDLKNDKEVVLAAVAENGMVLRDASEALKDDKEVVFEAIDQNRRALKYASKSLQSDKKFQFEYFCWYLQRKFLLIKPIVTALSMSILTAMFYQKKIKPMMKRYNENRIISQKREFFAQFEDDAREKLSVLLNTIEGRNSLYNGFEDIHGLKPLGTEIQQQGVSSIGALLDLSRTLLKDERISFEDPVSLFPFENPVIALSDRPPFHIYDRGYIERWMQQRHLDSRMNQSHRDPYTDREISELIDDPITRYLMRELKDDLDS